jgi:hypothetical protein
VGEFVALLTNETLPEAAPAELGANVTVNGTLCPALTVTGNEIPLTEYPAPVQFADDTTILVPPDVKVPVSCLFVLT